MISGTRLGYSYGTSQVLSDVDLHVGEGETVALVGPNGSGKTTLLRTLYGSLNAQHGTVRVDGIDLVQLRPKTMAKQVAVVVQEHSGDLPMRVTDMVLLGRLPHQGISSRPSSHDLDVVAQSLRSVGAVHLARREFSALSGGEKQRVLIARALAQEATHILLDEPTNHLDIRYQHEILELISGLSASVAVVLHDLNLAARYCDHVVVLDRGHVAAAGTPDAVFVPAILEPVYQVGVQRADVAGDINLVFRPLTDRVHTEAVDPAVGQPLETRSA